MSTQFDDDDVRVDFDVFGPTGPTGPTGPSGGPPGPTGSASNGVSVLSVDSTQNQNFLVDLELNTVATDFLVLESVIVEHIPGVA